MVPDEGMITIEVLEKVVGRRIYTYDKKDASAVFCRGAGFICGRCGSAV